jgi:hypothetical protein
LKFDQGVGALVLRKGLLKSVGVGGPQELIAAGSFLVSAIEPGTVEILDGSQGAEDVAVRALSLRLSGEIVKGLGTHQLARYKPTASLGSFFTSN